MESHTITSFVAVIAYGQYNRLKINRQTDNGLYLAKGHEEEVLLPNIYMPKTWEVGDELEVFVYMDSEDRPVATTLKPYIHLNEFACLQVKDVNTVGAFLDWGFPKDLFVPFNNQAERMVVGEKYVVYMYLDKQTNRMVASSKLSHFVENTAPDLAVGQQVDLIVYKSTELGFKAIINNKYEGLIFRSEVFTDLRVGKETKGFVRSIRPDGKIDLALQLAGYETIDAVSQEILDVLKKNDGYLSLTDKSDPEDIKREFQISKKAFKKAIGALYKDRKIKLDDKGISLITT